jgi:hypothetical protein
MARSVTGSWAFAAGRKVLFRKTSIGKKLCGANYINPASTQDLTGTFVKSFHCFIL